MKNVRKSLLALLLCAALAFAFAACAETGGGKGGGKGESHSIACTDGKWYDISADHAIAPAGETVTVSVDAEPFLQIDKVLAGDTECKAGSEAGTYTFVMPAEDVTVTAEVSDAPEMLHAESGMGWTLAPAEIAAAKEASYDAVQSYEVTFGTDPVNNSISSDNGMIYAEVFSTNESVIPNDAFSVIRSGNDNIASYSCSFKLDLSKLSPGTATIVFTETDGGRMLTRTVTVFEEGKLFADELVTAEVTLDLSALKEGYGGESFRLHLGCEECLFGSACPEYQNFDFTYPAKGNAVTYTCYFLKGRDFDVWVGYAYVNEYGVTVYRPFTIASGAEEDVINVEEAGESILIVLDVPQEQAN